MADDRYCDPADLHDFGLPRGAVPNPGRLAGSVSAASNVVELEVHGFALNDAVTFRAEIGGVLSSPLVAGTTYYAIPLTEDTFSVAATVGGSAIDILTNGSGVIVITPLPILASISWASRLIDDMLPAHVVPLTAPYPAIVRMTCAELAAGKLVGSSGATSKSLTEMVDYAKTRLTRWAKGVPVRGDNAPKSANLSCTATLPYLDSRGWSRFGGIG